MTLVADPDGLLVEEGVIQGIEERGFELIPFDDHVAFRFAYESRYRSRWDSGQMTDLVVILRSAVRDLNSLPYDLLQSGRKLAFDLGDLFPHLSYPVIAALGRGDLDALYEAQMQYNPEPMGDNASKDFVLRHVFQIALELIQQPSDLLRVLLRRHHQGQRLSKLLDDRFIQLLRQSARFEEWPLEIIVPDREAFFAFLQERWPRFVARWLEDQPESQSLALSLNSSEEPSSLKVADLPFDHDDVRVYIDNLFFEGFLKPIDLSDSALAKQASLTSSWVAIGLHTDAEADRLRRLEGLIKSLQELLPEPNARHQVWLAYAHRWAEFVALWQELDPSTQSEQKPRFYSLRETVDAAFFAWIRKRYGGLHNQPATPPVMLHHVPRYLAREIEGSKQQKVALVVIDGLALDQWVILREVIAQQRSNLTLREDAVFAWVPTITSVSRQATFAGKPPIFFPLSIHTTSKEPALWTQFWVDQGLVQNEVAYARGLGDDASLSEVERVSANPKIRVVGLVVDKVDRIMHGMELGTAGMHNQVRQWAAQGFLAKMLDLLLDSDFVVMITADHGNIEAEGYGRLAEGAIADVRGERVRVYPDPSLRARVTEHFPGAIEWPTIGLPEKYLPLLAPGRSAFIAPGKRLVGHGGISIEEVVIPLVRVERRIHE